MAFISILKTETPEVGLSTREQKPAVTITEKGRLVFSTQASAIFDGAELASVGYDKDARKVRIMALAAPEKGRKVEDYFTISKPKGKNSKVVSIAMARLFAALGSTHGLKYVPKDSGVQKFDVVMDLTKKGMVFVLPEASLTPPIPKPRRPRNPKPATNGTPAPAPESAGDSFGLDQVGASA